ncbi:MAG: SpoIIE family protein phosphatase [Mogibacterium sp.]|nr:SpoIIE family protein phosphatase [Mogibacterium sp.]
MLEIWYTLAMYGANEERKSIGHKTMIGIIVFTMLLTIAVSVPVSYGFSVLSRKHYYEDALDYAGIISHVINGDTVSGFVETGEKNEYYNNTGVFLVSFCEEVGLTDISIFVPDGDEVIYVWDTKGGEGDYDLGDRSDSYRDYSTYYDFDPSEDESIERKLIKAHSDDDVYISAFAPLYGSDGSVAAIVCVTQPEVQLGKIISQFILATLILAAIFSSVMMLIIYRLIRKNFIRPISLLTKSAEAMVGNLEGEEAVSIDIHTNDELETLADAFTKMDIDLREYIEELSAVTAERERIIGELDAAAKIQMGILPKKGMQYEDMDEFDLAASMTPAREVGGDFYDIFMADDRHLVLVIADVSGKGVPASLFMVATKILIKYGMKQGLNPSEAFSAANEKLIESNDMELFVTAWLVQIDLDTGECIEINAGHEHPALRKTDGIYELVKYKHSPALAALEDTTFKERSFRLDPGDSIFVYTDGVTEATNADMKLFGEERLNAALNKNSGASPDELLKNVNESIEEFVGDAPQFDDITMLAFRYNGK